MHFVQQSTTRLLSSIKSIAKRKRGYSTIVVKVVNATKILDILDATSWWVGRVQGMRWHNEKQFGVLRQAVDLLARMEESGRRNPNNPHIEVMLQYYRKYSSRNKFKYDHTHSKWIDVDYVIYIATMSYNSTNEVYTLDRYDSKQLSKFMTKLTI